MDIAYIEFGKYEEQIIQMLLYKVHGDQHIKDIQYKLVNRYRVYR